MNTISFPAGLNCSPVSLIKPVSVQSSSSAPLLHKPLTQDVFQKQPASTNTPTQADSVHFGLKKKPEESEEAFQKRLEKSKGSQKRYERSPNGKESQRRYQRSAKGKVTLKNYRQSSKGIAARKKASEKYEGSAKAKAAREKYNRSDRRKESQRRYQESLKQKRQQQPGAIANTPEAAIANNNTLYRLRPPSPSARNKGSLSYILDEPSPGSSLSPPPTTTCRGDLHHQPFHQPPGGGSGPSGLV
jgi:hypothetical protein